MKISIVLCSNNIVPFVRRIAYTGTVSQQYTATFLGAFYSNSGWIYFDTLTDIDTKKSWLTTAGLTLGTEEDLTPSGDMLAWFNSYGSVGEKNKQQVYAALVIAFPGTECI